MHLAHMRHVQRRNVGTIWPSLPCASMEASARSDSKRPYCGDAAAAWGKIGCIPWVFAPSLLALWADACGFGTGFGPGAPRVAGPTDRDSVQWRRVFRKLSKAVQSQHPLGGMGQIRFGRAGFGPRAAPAPTWRLPPRHRKIVPASRQKAPVKRPRSKRGQAAPKRAQTRASDHLLTDQ